WESTAERRRLPADRYVFLYGKYRRVVVPELDEGPRNLTDAQFLDELASHAGESRTLTLTQPDNRLLQNLPGYLRGLNLARASDPRREGVWTRLNTAVTELDDSLSGIRMDPGETALVPRIVRNGIPLDVTQLSDGYQALLVIVLDLILRYPYLFFE